MKNKKPPQEYEKVIFPKIDLERAISICKNVHGVYGDVVSREQLAKICKVKAKGGGFQNIVDALKNNYGFMEKDSQSEYRLTEFAQQAISGDKQYLMKVLMKIEPFRTLIDRYHNNNFPKKAVIKEVLKDKFNISNEDSRTIANKFIKNIDYISKFSSSIIQEAYSVHPSEIRDYAITSAIKISWAISYLKQSNNMDKKTILNILDNMLKESDKFEKLKKEIETAKRFFQYSDEKSIIAYIKDNFEKAFAKDFNLETLSDLVEYNDNKHELKKEIVKQNQIINNFDIKKEEKQGESLEDETDDEPNK